jgi:hypothetical protein
MWLAELTHTKLQSLLDPEGLKAEIWALRAAKAHKIMAAMCRWHRVLAR